MKQTRIVVLGVHRSGAERIESAIGFIEPGRRSKVETEQAGANHAEKALGLKPA